MTERRCLNLASGQAFAISAEATWDARGQHGSVFTRSAATVPQLLPLAELVTRLSKAAVGTPGITVVVAQDALRLLGLPDNLDGHSGPLEAITAVRDAGWRAADPGHWTSFWSPPRPAVHMCVPAWQGSHEAGLIDGEDLAATARRLAWYAACTSAPYHLTAGVSAIASLRDGRPWQRAPFWNPSWDRLNSVIRLGERDLAWTAEDSSRPMGYVHRYDARMAYLASAAMVEVAADQLQRITSPQWDKTLAGYWLISPPAWNHPQVPSPLHSLVPDKHGRLWVSTPTLGLVLELAAAGECGEPELHEAWLAPGVRRVLRGWAEQLRDSITAVTAFAELHPNGATSADAAAVLRELKATYREGIGMFARPGGRVLYRPDWRHAVISQARVSLWRRAWTIGKAEGRWPVRIATDSLDYPSPIADPVEACPRGLKLGDGLGRFRVAEGVSA